MDDEGLRASLAQLGVKKNLLQKVSQSYSFAQ